MANIKQQKKRVRTNELRRQRNVAVRSRVKSYIKQAHDAIDANDPVQIDEALRVAVSEIDIAARKGVYHANNAARKKSRLQRRAASAGKS